MSVSLSAVVYRQGTAYGIEYKQLFGLYLT